jgi:hypothetical protein
MPRSSGAQHGIGLNNLQSRFPGAQPAGQENDDGAVTPGQPRSLGLTFEDDDLLTR